MKKLMMVVLLGLALAGCGNEQAKQVGIGINSTQLVDGISIPMIKTQNSIDGEAISGNVQNQDGGLVTLYAAINGDSVTKARFVIMPSQRGNLPSDAENLKTMLRVLHNVAPDWKESQDWFANAFRSAHASPNVSVSGIHGKKRFTVIEVPELRSFELEISPVKN